MALRTSFLRRFMFLIITAASVATAAKDQFLDVEALTPKIFLGNLGSFVGDLTVDVVGNIPALPVAAKTNDPPTFDFVLKTGQHQISLRIRADNLRVIGYKMQTPEKWLEFGTKSTHRHLIRGSESLGFGGGYGALERAARTKVTDVSCAKSEFVKAVNDLAVTTVVATRARSLILILQMVVESARYRDVEYLIANNFYDPSCRIKPYMVDPLEKNWEKLSTMVIKATYDRCYRYIPPKIEGDRGDTLEQLSNRFGILHRDPSTLKPPCTVTSPLNAAATTTIEQVAQP